MKLLEKHFEIALETPDGITRLRELILKFAMQGKLVAQQINERVLLKRKVDKEVINKESQPFIIPQNWTWEYLGNVVNIKSSKRIFESDYTNTGIPFFRSKEVGELSRTGTCENRLFIPEYKYNEIKKKYGVPSKGDILLTSVGSIGNCWIVDEREFYYKDGNVTQLEINDSILSEYLKYFIQSNVFFSQVNSSISGTAYNALTIIKIKTLKIPLPPLEEQKRIVEKIEQLILLCDQLEKQRDIKNQSVSKINNAAINKLLTSTNGISFKEATCFINDNFNELYSTTSAVDELRRAILSLGVCGKFEIDSKKSIHSKKYPTIPTNEEPFKLPENWIWTKLENLGETQTGTTPPKKNPEFYGDYIPFLGPGDIKDFKINYTNEGLSKLGIEKARFIARNSILMVCIGGSIGKMAINDRDVTCNQQINTITPYEGVHLNYLSAVLQSEYFQNKILLSSGGSATPIINKGKWISIPIPLPPLDIQIEISNKIENLLNLCRTLEDSISKVSIKQTQILNSVLAIS